MSRPGMPATAAIDNLGCKVNQAEMEAAGRFLRAAGIDLVDAGVSADLVVVNTCTVTAEADRKSRHAVARARRTSPDADIVVTGCSVQVGPEAFGGVDPRARLVDNRAKDGLLAELAALAGPAAPGGATDRPMPTLTGAEIEGVADDRTAVERTRAFVKVQDGCSFFCTYCIIPTARGPERSLAPEAVLADVRRALAGGHREVVLTGINIGTYDGGWSERGARGAHRRSALTLGRLVGRILAETGVERIRLSSVEPQHVDEELLAAWRAGAPRTLPHFHLPLQSGDDDVLRRMGRRYDTARYAEVVDRVRAAIPGVAVHADVIVGFPTETEAAFGRTVGFVRALDLAGLHVFRYSSRPGTPAIRMAGHVDEPEKKRRAGHLLAIAAEGRARWAAAAVGGERSVLFEARLPDGRWVGKAEDYTVVTTASASDPDLENWIGRVAVDRVDPAAADRAVGRIVALSQPARRLGRPLPLAAGGPDAA